MDKLSGGRKKILYLDCFSGISGDMFLGALLDAGLPLEHLREELSRIPLPGYHLEAQEVCYYGITGTSLEVVPVEEQPPLRHLKDIRELLEASTLSSRVRDKTMAAFLELARAEGKIHGQQAEEVHFHEIGALDTVVDIAGGVLGVEILGANQVISSPLPQGRGFIEIDHGTYPLPAPATTEILSKAEAPVYGVEVKGELVTPTGAVLVKTLADGFGEMPSFSLKRVGYGAGSKDFGYPNFLRIFWGEQEDGLLGYQEPLDVIEINMDDFNPEIAGHVINLVLEEGALDAYFTPVQMKKSRPGVKLTVLSHPSRRNALTKMLFRETSTLGCRIFSSQKVMLPRTREEIDTPWGKLGVKVAWLGEEVLDFAPEHQDCLDIARREGITLKEVYREVEHLYWQCYRNWK